MLAIRACYHLIPRSSTPALTSSICHQRALAQSRHLRQSRQSAMPPDKGAQCPPIASLIRVEVSSSPQVGGSVDASKTVSHHRTPWLTLSTIAYRFAGDATSHPDRKWDVASRTTRQSAASADAVVVLARLTLADDVERLLLVKQFRPPVNAVTLELPAGLVDAGETFEHAALRELREETGFVGTVRRLHKPATLSPGMNDETVVLVEVDIKGASPKEQQLDPNENICVISVPLMRLPEAVDYLESHENVLTMHAVSTLAVGLRLHPAQQSD